jgi:hypothetical protein
VPRDEFPFHTVFTFKFSNHEAIGKKAQKRNNQTMVLECFGIKRYSSKSPQLVPRKQPHPDQLGATRSP